MIAFLHDEAANMLRCLLQRFVKQAVLKAADAFYKLIKLDLANEDMLLTYKKVDISIGAVKYLTNCKASDLVKMQFK